MKALASSPSVRRLFVLSIVARLPEAMFGIGVLVHAKALTGSFASAGIVAAAEAAALGVGGPLLGRLTDRRGQTAVLLGSGALAGAALAGLALLPHGAPVALIAALAAVAGFAEPPVGACLRALLPGLADDDGEAARAAYAADAAATELTWIAGPPLVLVLAGVLSSGAALAIVGVATFVATTAFALQPASREWRPEPAAERPRGGSLRAPALRTLVVILGAVGLVFGATEVAVTAAATDLGNTAAAGPLLGLWGAGSFLGGLVAARLGGGARTGAGLALVLAGLAAGHLLLAAAATSVVALAAGLVAAGAMIAPAYASVYPMIERAAPAGTVTEAFAWAATAAAIGSAAGSALGGAVVDAAGATTAFVVAGAAGAVAVAVTVLRAHALDPAPAAAVEPAAA